jgi:hypothetical protein
VAIFSFSVTWGYSHSTPSGLWCRGRNIPQVLFTFNPFRVVVPGTKYFPGGTKGYSHSTPSGLWYRDEIFPRWSLGLFTFSGLSFAQRNLSLKNPFRVVVPGRNFPQVEQRAIHIQPLQGCGTGTKVSPGSAWGYSHFQAKVSPSETLA